LPPPRPSAIPLPEPEALPQQQAMLPPPKPAAPQTHRREPTPRPPAHLGFPGPAATRDEYLAYCNALIRQHFDMLPPSFIGERRGLTVLSLEVLDDGRIARVSVIRSSGYHDIDERVERMVAAVGRFPPLPQWFQGEEMALEYELPFPAGLVRR
jgi:TonB family protein